MNEGSALRSLDGRGPILPETAAARFQLAKALFDDLRICGPKRECLQAEEAARIWLDSLAEHLARPGECLWLDAVRIETPLGTSVRMVLMDRCSGWIHPIPCEIEPDLSEVVMALLGADGSEGGVSAVTVTHAGARFTGMPTWVSRDAG